MLSSIILLWTAAFCSAAPSPQKFEAAEPHMGTLFRIVLYAPDQATASKAFREAFARVRELDATLSDYKPDSELSRLSKATPGQPVRVSEDLFRVLSAAQQLARETDGAFDITAGPAALLWREARTQGRPPDKDALQEALSRIGYRKLILNPEAGTVTLQGAGMQLDLGGIAKGYAADEAMAALRRNGIESALVAASGDLVTGDPPPGRPGWRVGIAPMPSAEGGYVRIVTLSNCAVSTSGDAEQHVEIGGIRYSHIVDPKTGSGLMERMAASVIARNGMAADSLATAVSVMGAEKGLKLVNGRPDAVALAVMMNRDGDVDVRGPGAGQMEAVCSSQ